MKTYFLILIVSLMLSCGSENSIDNAIIEKTDGRSAVIAAISPSPIPSPSAGCGESENYCLKIVEDAKREAKNINVLSGDKIISTIELPSPLDYNGYALNWARKNKDGFEISIEYGSRYYFEKIFYFNKTDDKFALTEIKVKNFDKSKPESSTTKIVKTAPPVSIDNFSITNYMDN